MRKIISILVTLGVVLGLSVMAAPAAGAACTVPVVAGDASFCAGGTDTYILGPYAAPVTLTAPNDKLSVDFPTGTSLAGVAAAGILVNAVAVPAADITVSGTHLEFKLPIALGTTFPAGTVFTVTINGVVNPTTTGSKTLNVDYKLVCCDAVVFNCGTYTVVPAISTLNFHFDFDKTYTGIAEDFIPPFKACGQTDYGFYNATVGWMNVFDVILRADVPGCIPPCTNATMWFALTKCPTDETVTFHWDTTGTTLMYTLTVANVGTNYTLPNVILPGDKTWECRLHFSSPGDYEFSFYLQCPAVPCLAGSQIVAQKALPVKVYQWKDSAKITLDEKWNLISLPLVPFNTSITDLLKSLDPEALNKDGVDDLQSIWNYQWNAAGTAAEWKSWEGTLTTMESGRAYWARLTYPITASPAYNWWVFGTAKNMPPSNPLAYNMNVGWNMFGFTRLAADTVVNYLWNFGTPTPPELPYPLMYGWFNSGTAATSDWDLIVPGVDSFVVGQGYWGYFPFGGIIVP